MTDAINYLQSMFIFKSYSSINFGKSENRLAHTLVKEGRAFVAIANQEFENGKTTLDLAVNEKNTALSLNLAAIALWHYQRAARKYRQAVSEFEQASRIWQQSKRQRLMESEAKKMSEKAIKAESAVKFLNDFIQKNSK